MDKSSELDCYLYFMVNAWNHDICIELYGKETGPYIWGKWCDRCDRCTIAGAAASFYYDLDRNKRKVLVDRAIRHYNPS